MRSEELATSEPPHKQVSHESNQVTRGDAFYQVMYEAVSNRRLTFDSMMWQVPVLSLTAQAFLLTIALGADTSQYARSVSAGLACVTAVMSLQLMAKHRYHEILDAKMLERLEKKLIAASLDQHAPEATAHSSPRRRAQDLESEPNLLVKLSSYRVWLLGMSLFALVDAITLVFAVAHPEVFK